MIGNIFGYITTEHVDEDNYRTVFDWVIPSDDDTDKAVRDATKRFAEELRRTIQAHR